MLLIDWMLSDDSGANVLRWIRQNLGADVPVPVITACKDEDPVVTKIRGMHCDADTRTVDIHISRLRKKLSFDGNTGWKLNPVYGYGHRFDRIDQPGSNGTRKVSL